MVTNVTWLRSGTAWSSKLFWLLNKYGESIFYVSCWMCFCIAFPFSSRSVLSGRSRPSGSLLMTVSVMSPTSTCSRGPATGQFLPLPLLPSVHNVLPSTSSNMRSFSFNDWLLWNKSRTTIELGTPFPRKHTFYFELSHFTASALLLMTSLLLRQDDDLPHKQGQK